MITEKMKSKGLISDFISQRYVGKKLPINKVLNHNLIILDYRIDDSIYHDNKSSKGKCLYVSFYFADDPEGTKRFFITGSSILMSQLKGISKENLPLTGYLEKQKTKSGNLAYRFT